MKAHIWLPDMEVKSKQHSRSYTRTGRTFTNHLYAGARDAFGITAMMALASAGWREPVNDKVAMRLSYRGRFDVDNAAGFIMDALQGVAYVRDSQVIMLAVRKRLKGNMGVGITLRTLDIKLSRKID